MSKKHQNGKSWRDEQLVTALLEESSLVAAARKAHISVRTVQRRMTDEEFLRKFREAKLRVLHETTARLTANSTRAAEVLRQIFDDKNAMGAARVSAATRTIRLTLDALEVEELEERITRLEALTRHAE